MAGQGDRTLEELSEAAAAFAKGFGGPRPEEGGSKEGGSEEQDPPYVFQERYA